MTLQIMQTEKYIMFNIKNERILKTYMQKIFYHVKTIKFEFTYNQLLIN